MHNRLSLETGRPIRSIRKAANEGYGCGFLTSLVSGSLQIRLFDNILVAGQRLQRNHVVLVYGRAKSGRELLHRHTR